MFCRYVRGLGSLQFTNGSSPVASKMFIFSGNSLAESKAPPLPISCFFSHPYLQWLEVIRQNGTTKGVRLSIICEGLYSYYFVIRGINKVFHVSNSLPGPSQVLEPRRQTCVQELRFGATAEDVLTLLGSPSRVFYKVILHGGPIFLRVSSKSLSIVQFSG